MDMDVDESSPSVIPESPPTIPASTPSSTFQNESHQSQPEQEYQPPHDEETMDDEDRAEDYAIQDYDDDGITDENNKAKTVQHKNPPDLRCNFNVVIDIDQIDLENVPEPALTSTGPAERGNRGHSSKNKDGITTTKVVPDPDDPFASDDDDCVIMHQVEELEKSFNESKTSPRRVSISPIDHIVQEMLEERQAKRREEFAKLKRLGPNERIFPDVRPSNFHTVAFLMKVIWSF